MAYGFVDCADGEEQQCSSGNGGEAAEDEVLGAGEEDVALGDERAGAGKAQIVARGELDVVLTGV